eukprot:6475607-Amphidinium_carterae.2
MAALEALVPEEIEAHFRLNLARLRSYPKMRAEVSLLLEARTAARLQTGAVPMDLDSFHPKKPGKGN